MKRRLTTDELCAVLGLIGLFAGLTLALSVGWALVAVSGLLIVYAFLPGNAA